MARFEKLTTRMDIGWSFARTGVDTLTVQEAIELLGRSGWTVQDFAISGESGTVIWLVSGSNGENLIRVQGPTAVLAWQRAVEQAAAVGMLKGWPRPSSGMG